MEGLKSWWPNLTTLIKIPQRSSIPPRRPNIWNQRNISQSCHRQTKRRMRCGRRPHRCARTHSARFRYAVDWQRAWWGRCSYLRRYGYYSDPNREKERGITYRRGCGVDLAGGVGTLSYEHHNISEPAILYVPSSSSFGSFLSHVFFFLSFPLLHYPLLNIRSSNAN